MNIGPETVVTLAYTLSATGKDGVLSPIEIRSVDNPIEFIFGKGLLLPAIEKKLEKKSKGYKATVTLMPADAFGDFKQDLEQWYDIKKLPKAIVPQVGMKFQTQGPTGDVVSVLVKEIRGEQVLIDGNHPLAGETVQFEMEVLRVRQATPEEISSGEIKKQFH